MAAARRFLIVDDDPVFAAVAEGVLLSLGEEHVSTAGDGAEGLVQLAAADPPVDVVILDLNMPRLDGLAYIRALSDAGFRGHVVLSSGETDAIVQSAHRMGTMLGVSMPGTLRKPLKRDALASLLARCPADEPAETPVGGEIGDTAGSTLVPFYQPQFDIGTGALVGLEALIRLQTQDGRLFGPSTLFERIKDSAQLKSVTVDIAAKVMDDIRHWRERGVTRRVSINLDAQIAEDPLVMPALVELARARDVDPATLVFELTETALPASASRLLEALTRLRMSGFGVAIDDYGTGTSNYGLLRLCPFTELKIDRSIVRAAVTDTIARRFMNGAVATAADLGMEVVAEGVETFEELACVRDANIRVVQGFIFSRPIVARTAFTAAGLAGDDPRVGIRATGRS